MIKQAKKYIAIAVITTSVGSLVGCNTTSKMIKHGKLEVQTKMSETIFLDPIDNDKKTILLQIRNTRGLPKSDEKKVERCYNLGVQIIKKICKIEDNMAQ